MKRISHLLVALTLAFALSSCAASSASLTAEPRPDEISDTARWEAARQHVLQESQTDVEARARVLAYDQAQACRELRSAILEGSSGTSSSLYTSRLARCEEDLLQYRRLAGIGAEELERQR